MLLLLWATIIIRESWFINTTLPQDKHLGTWGWEERLGKGKGHGSVYIPDLGQRRDRNVRENGEVTVTQETEAQHPFLSLLFWGFLNLGTHTSTPAALGHLLCQLL